MMRRQVLSRVWAAVGARSLRARPVPGTVQSFCSARALCRSLSRKARRGPRLSQEPWASRGPGAHSPLLPARSRAETPPSTPQPRTRRACPVRPGAAPGAPRPLRSDRRGRRVVKMLDVDPSYFQGMKVVPLSIGLSPGDRHALSRGLGPPTGLFTWGGGGGGAADVCGLKDRFSELATG